MNANGRAAFGCLSFKENAAQQVLYSRALALLSIANISHVMLYTKAVFEGSVLLLVIML